MSTAVLDSLPLNWHCWLPCAFYDPVCTVPFRFAPPATFEYEPFLQGSFTLHCFAVCQALLRSRFVLFGVGISRIVLVLIGYIQVNDQLLARCSFQGWGEQPP
jgi:hypothetical protein